ncbi:MAG: glutathione synthase [Rickettsiales bacterium]|nr:glutathione synthase [Rickettsiales bacterium]
MTLRIAIQMDPPERLNAQGDSTILLAEEAQRRGYQLWWYPAASLCLRASQVWTAQARSLQVLPQAALWYVQGEPQHLSLNDVDVVLMRQDPPFDMAYLSATYLLERLDTHTLVANHPFHVRNAPEKLFPFLFEDCMPPTLIAQNAAAIREFLQEQGDIVVKPLYGFGGHGVFRLHSHSDNVEATLEMLLSHPEPLVAQRFLPEVSDGDRRVVMMDGDVVGLLGRLPAAGEIRANLRVGGSAAKAKLTSRQQLICDRLAPELRARGLIFAGVDFIGDWLTEVNVTSPTGLRAIKALDGSAPEAAFWDAIERRLAASAAV